MVYVSFLLSLRPSHVLLAIAVVDGGGTQRVERNCENGVDLLEESALFREIC
jgi:hypothetical protein